MRNSDGRAKNRKLGGWVAEGAMEDVADGSSPRDNLSKGIGNASTRPSCQVGIGRVVKVSKDKSKIAVCCPTSARRSVFCGAGGFLGGKSEGWETDDEGKC